MLAVGKAPVIIFKPLAEISQTENEEVSSPETPPSIKLQNQLKIINPFKLFVIPQKPLPWLVYPDDNISVVFPG